MISSDAYNYINILNKAANASWTKNEIIANNIANVDTPDYKRKDMDFESTLARAISQKSTSNMDQKVKNVQGMALRAGVYTDYSQLSYRYDGNNVDIDTESAYLADNQLKYYTVLNSINQEFSRIKMVLQK
ncbi:MAG: flagellar basal body rod protein FlgB [Lachnospiraceae bacterium]|nr:flagellar basal body rod protein FlgB [Lachnospiraceae bacterium]